MKGHYGTLCSYGKDKKECNSCYLIGCALRYPKSKPKVI